jgi:hypothetical protein
MDDTAALVVATDHEIASARIYLDASRAASTRRAYADVWKIQQVSRHKSMQVLAGYVRDARLFDDHAGDGFL